MKSNRSFEPNTVKLRKDFPKNGKIKNREFYTDLNLTYVGFEKSKGLK